MLSIFGNLISKFGLSKVVASTIVGLLSTGASYSVMINFNRRLKEEDRLHWYRWGQFV